MRFHTSTFAATAIAAASLLAAFAPAAFASADLANTLANRVMQDDAAIAYLGLTRAEAETAKTENSWVAANLNGDALTDDAVVVALNGRSVVAAFTAQDGGNAGTRVYCGFIPVDSDSAPSLRATDITGDGRDEVRVESVRVNEAGAGKRVLHLMKLDGSRLKRIFLAVLDSAEKHGIYQQRTTHLVRFKDTDGDGVNEIEVTARSVELLGVGKDKEREIAESVTTATTTYKLGENGFSAVSTVSTPISCEQRLVVASRLVQAGAMERAALHAHAVLEQVSARADAGDRNGKLVLAARNILENIPAASREAAAAILESNAKQSAARG